MFLIMVSLASLFNIMLDGDDLWAISPIKLWKV